MLRYLAWVLRSIRKDLALGNYTAIWQKTLARFGLIGELLARGLRLSPQTLVAVRLGVDLGDTDRALVAAGCLRRGVLLTDGLNEPGLAFDDRARFAGIVKISKTTTMTVADCEVRYTTTIQIGRLRLKTRLVRSAFRHPPAAQPLVLRELARLRLIDFDRYLEAWLRSLPGERLDPESPVVLYLPEVGLRNPALASEPLISFAGITADQGWLGCAQSYRSLARLALQSGVSQLTVLEDDAVLPAGWRDRWGAGRELVSRGRANLASGLVSDLQRLPKTWRIERSGEDEFFVSDHMSSTVFTIFGESALRWLTSYPAHASDPNTEGIDRYLATMPGVAVGVFRPALVEHDPAARSTLWRFNNRTYRAQIDFAEELLASATRAPGVESKTRQED